MQCDDQFLEKVPPICYLYFYLYILVLSARFSGFPSEDTAYFINHALAL